MESEGGRVLVRFPATGEQRRYAADQAPLRRVAFRPGEQVTARDGGGFVVEAVVQEQGRLVYRGPGGRTLPEGDLGDAMSFASPEQRLLHGQTDPLAVFELRRQALEHQHRRRQSPVRGFVGGRMDLIPHQLYLAREITSRQAPRVLLADEVGLGKTIEACLIVHRLLATGRAARVLIVVPEPLVHQWFVELLRRFNLWFHIFDESRCDALETAQPDANPFLDDQLVLCALPLLLDPRRAEQAVAAGWDMLVVDEAHHLRWSPAAASPEYAAVDAVSRKAEGLLLLTATPEQLGLAGHFARLRLLDPNRYFDFEAFKQESARFAEVAGVANRLLMGGALTSEDQAGLHAILGGEPEATQGRMEALGRGDAGARERLLAELLDRHGPGRVIMRNTRAAMQGFPRRVPCPVRLRPPSDDPRLADRLAAEFGADIADAGSAGYEPEFGHDPRMAWFAEFLRRAPGVKVLLICRTQAKVLAIDRALRERMTVPTALFHEGLELVQRDRNAAWFADPEGAQILLASEIGSEGRNFQFAQHLVLFDLPLDPELVEQRIGRLDRIGQSADIQIHVPHVANTPQEVLFHWFHDGLDAFGRNLHAGRPLLEQFGAEVRDLALDFHETHDTRRPELEALIARTRVARLELERRLEQGRDRLLELNSFRPGLAREVVEAVAALDRDSRLEEFLLRIWDHYGVPVEDQGPRWFKIGADGVFAESFPGLPADGLAVTFDRRTALSREEIAFLTWDHPMVTGALDLLLGSPAGTTGCVAWPTARERDLWVETIHVLECVAPARLHADRFLSATPLCAVVDARGREVPAAALAAMSGARLEDTTAAALLDHPQIHELLPRLAAAAGRLAEGAARPVVAAAVQAIEAQLGRELDRLRALAAVNPNVRPEEVAATEAQRADLRQHIGAARLRLDSVRLILLGDW